MDLLNDFINQSTRLATTNGNSGSGIEPIFGGSPSAGTYQPPQAALPTQQFSEAVPFQAPTPIMSQPVMSQETLQKFSCYNPVGSPPSDYGPSKSCAKCHYFETNYSESYGRDRAGYCAKFDFPCSSGYTCSAFELYGSVKPDTEVMRQAFSDSANELLNKLETPKPTEVLAEPVVVTPVAAPAPAPAPAVEPVTPAPVAEPLQLSQPAAVAPVVTVPTKTQAVVFADPELYSEARDMTVTRFSNPDSAMAQEYTRQKYVSKFRAKHGSVTKAFG